MTYTYKSINDVDVGVPKLAKKGRKNRRRFLVGGVGVAAVVVIVVVVTVPVAEMNGKNGSTSIMTMCLSDECIKLSASVRAALD